MAGVAIQRQRIYTCDEVEHILRDSERRAGHSFERHVGIPSRRTAVGGDRLSLEVRGEQSARNTNNGEIIDPRTAFIDNQTQFLAVRDVLNSPVGQTALGALDQNPTGTQVGIEGGLTQAIPIRYAAGNIVRPANAELARVIVVRIEQACCFGIHILTAFPVLYARHPHGLPSWQLGQGPWMT